MTISIPVRADRGLVIAVLLLLASSQLGAEDRYPFVAQQAGNSFDNYICAGLACGIACLEEGVETDGVEFSQDLAHRLWNSATDPVKKGVKFVYRSNLQLRNGATVPICSKAAIEEIGFLVQAEYKKLVDEKLWKVDVVADPATPEGRAVLEIRQEYLDLRDRPQVYSVTSLHELKNLFNETEDEDGLVALSGKGYRLFERGTPQKVLTERNITVDLKTGNLPIWIESNHAFLLTYDKEKDQIYAFDSDDPDGKWPVAAEGFGRSFRIAWRIDDHMGNGPSQQGYYNVRLLNEFLRDIRAIIDGNSTSTP